MKEGLITKVKIVQWRDADTPIVEVSRQFPVRLIDTDKKGQFNCPEKKTVEGKKAKKFAESLVKNIDNIYLYVPSKNPIQLTDISSFDRILGEIWIEGDKLTDILINNGFGEIK